MQLRVGKPVKLTIPCAGIAPGGTVTVKVFEPHALGGDPIDTVKAKVAKDGGVAEVSWTYDHAKHKDKVTAARFVLLAEGAGRVTISEPFEFVEPFEATVKDGQGHPAAYRQVVLHAERGEDIHAGTDAEGKVKLLVPPGEYHLELGDLLPDAPPRETYVRETDPEPAAVAGTAAAAGAATEAAASEDEGDLYSLLGKKETGYWLSAQFLDATGRKPASGLAFKVEGQSGTTDDQGHARIPGLPLRDVEVAFAQGSVFAPVVHDPAIVCLVRLRFLQSLEPPPRPARGEDDAPPLPEELYERGEPGEPHEPEPAPDLSSEAHVHDYHDHEEET